MVSFRVGDDEYRELTRLCKEGDFRSVSDMARLAMRHWMEHGPAVPSENLHGRVANIEERVAELTARIERLQRQFAGNTSCFAAGHE